MTSSKLLCHRDEIPLPSVLTRTPNRPLGALSDYVVERLPNATINKRHLPTSAQLQLLCAEARKKMENIRSYADLCRAQYGEGNQIPPEQRATPHLALLDAAMLEGAYAHHKKTVHPALSEIIEQCARKANSIPGLTYQGLIHANPLSKDPRVFSPGEIGRVELLFHTIHNRIERQVSKAVKDVRYSMTPQSPKIIEQIDQGITGLENGFSSIHKGITPDEFLQFRHFFNNDKRKLPGPSGLFSAGVVCLDGLLARSAPGVRQLNEYKLRMFHMFPNTFMNRDDFCGNDDMQQICRSKSEDPDFLFNTSFPAADRQEVAGHMRHARAMHLGIAKRYIPEAFQEGTGGVQALRSFLTVAERAYASIEKIIPILSFIPSHGKPQ